jgi:uncharacterized protein YodC (DUF2158 family)
VERQKFKVGDLVQLKSGGPALTVVKLIPTGPPIEPGVECSWFHFESLAVRDRWFPEACLEPFPEAIRAEES